MLFARPTPSSCSIVGPAPAPEAVTSGGFRSSLDSDRSSASAARRARAELFLVGGAALAVAYDATRATRDLDAVFVPASIVRQAATAVGLALDLAW
jgi:hypothetical protein